MIINNPLKYQYKVVGVTDISISGTNLTPFDTGTARHGCYFCFDQDATWAFNTTTTGSYFVFKKGLTYFLGAMDSIKFIQVTTSTSTNFYLVEVKRDV